MYAYNQDENVGGDALDYGLSAVSETHELTKKMIRKRIKRAQIQKEQAKAATEAAKQSSKATAEVSKKAAEEAAKIAKEENEVKKLAYIEGTKLGVDTIRAIAEKLNKATDEIEQNCIK